MTDTLLTIIIIIMAVNTINNVWSSRHRIDPQRVALAIYGAIVEEWGTDNITSELARQQARIKYAEFCRLTGFPLSIRKNVVKRVVEMTREESKPYYIQNNLGE